jgi:hypothetical protein
MTSDSYSTFVTAHFPPQQYERKLIQATESALHMLTWKGQRNPREGLEFKAQSGSIEDWKAYILWEKKGKGYSPGLVLCCTSVLPHALRVNDGPIRSTAVLKLPFVDFGRTA